MSMSYGSSTSSTIEGELRFTITREGMTQSIYEQMDTMLSPPLQKLVDDAETPEEKTQAEDTLAQARHGWEKTAFAVAKGVIDHLVSNMEVHSIESMIDDNDLEVNGSTGSTGSHQHTVNIPVTGSLTMQQKNDGTGHVA